MEYGGGRHRDTVLNFLWFINFDYSTRNHNGATLRFFNYSRQLVAKGHRVYFFVQETAEDEQIKQFFNELKAGGIMTDVHFCTYLCPPWKTSLASLLVFPSLANAMVASGQKQFYGYAHRLAQQMNIDVCVFSDRKLFFLAPQFQPVLPTIIDFGDSYTLYRFRELKFSRQRSSLTPLLEQLRYLAESYLLERYYSRLSDANIVVSPIDKAAFDRINYTPEKNYVLLNGVAPSRNTTAQKIEGRMIFSGNMNFPPNYQSALWLIDEVLPRVFASHPNAYLVVAGANPVPELLARSNARVHITGFVDDMAAEIAASSLYIAPMITGGGFKNKVVEALMNRTYVAGTPMSVEFLSPEVVRHMLIADSAASLADSIIHYLSRPEEFESRLETLHAMILDQFSWNRRTEEFIKIVTDVLHQRS